MVPTSPQAKPTAHDADTKTTRCGLPTAKTLQRQLWIDTMIRWMLITTAMICLLLSTTMSSNNFAWPTVLAIAVMGVWFRISRKSSMIARQIPGITLLIEQDGVAAEMQLAQALGQRILPRSVRLTLYHRLAMLRRRQRRYDEVAVICQTVLPEIPTGGAYRNTIPAENGRVTWSQTIPVGNEQLQLHFLFMLADASLQCHRLTGAYLALKRLHACRINLIGLLQLVMLQSQYEIAAGHEAMTLQRIDQKIALAELMPAAQCGLLHALLAVAAKRTNQSTLYHWLKRRARLLGASDPF